MSPDADSDFEDPLSSSSFVLQLFTKPEFNDLVRDSDMPKDALEFFVSMLFLLIRIMKRILIDSLKCSLDRNRIALYCKCMRK